MDATTTTTTTTTTWKPDRRAFTRYAVALLAVGVAYLLTYLLGLVVSGDLSLLFMTAVMVAALYGGLGPGLLAGLLASVASAFFFLPPRYSFDIAADDLLRVVVFMFAATLVSWLSGARRRWEDALLEARELLEKRVRERTADLTAANRELEEEIAERRKAEARILSYQERLKSLAVELSTSEERQRRSIAAALHDAVGHRLAVGVMKLRGLLEEEPVPGRRGTAEVTRACELVEEAIEHTRSLTLQLSPPILYELGLEPAVEWLAEQVQKEAGLSVTVDDDGQPKATDEEIRPLLFNSVRELLVNVVKHARANSARVSLARDGGHVRVTVADDGVGWDGAAGPPATAATPGFGLFNIRERLAHLGGRLEVSAAPGAGCRVTLVAPLTTRPPRAKETRGASESCWSTTTRSSSRGSAACSRSSTTCRSSGRRPTAGPRSRWPASSAPTWSSWTSRCPA